MTRAQKRTLGIDEAGRGPVLGPMVLAAVALDTKAAQTLTRAGLCDSKSYGSTKKAKELRRDLAQEIRKRAISVRIAVVDVVEIDKRVARRELNALEREVASALIGTSRPVDRIVADGARLFQPLKETHPHLEALDNGESAHAAVAAASVVAKVRRDELFARIQRRYARDFGEIHGGGYVNKATTAFLRAYATKHRTLPPEARRSWPFSYLDDLLDPEEFRLS